MLELLNQQEKNKTLRYVRKNKFLHMNELTLLLIKDRNSNSTPIETPNSVGEAFTEITKSKT